MIISCIIAYNNKIIRKKLNESIRLSNMCYISMYPLKYWGRMGAVAYTCNPSTLGGWGGRIVWGQEFETSLVNMAKPRLYWKYKKV